MHTLSVLRLNIISQISTYDSTQNVGEIGDIIFDKDGRVNIFPDVQNGYQDEGKGDGALLEAGKGRQ